ncbi:outer membrane beta-barrel family protein [Flavobacterium restrictum]|uniref:TonB-dependent receptor n=1 Tax=Flavobacterium restrictum TaxID=2594428 RepID=A0A553DZU6_9FLAO|nr:outer membrane beta-barrel family protein [Flavobacterium restrictum]TRX38318.1 TonB-dependent receptor [Flavobacterium restrictum]
MKKTKLIASFILLLVSYLNFAQGQRPDQQQILQPTTKLKITGKVVEKVSKQPLEYATITFKNPTNPKAIAGGITNAKGEFDVQVEPGIYDVTVEFISFKPIQIKQKDIQKSLSLGMIALDEDASQLNEVVVRAEKSTVEIKLDKKVYNVGQDMIVKGGTVSDVLDNVPSVSVDTEGNVSLRGSDNIRILIDGRPSNAINIAEALRQIPADAIDKVEVITNPSARYDAEGGSGLINIVLKKGKNQGLNGTFIASTGIPETYGLSGNLNYKTEKFNFFTTTGYNYRTNEGGGLTNSTYLNEDGSIKSYLDESRDTQRLRKGLSSRVGAEWAITPTAFWTNAINYQKNTGHDYDLINYSAFDANHAFTSDSYRLNNANSDSKNVEFTSNFIKNFNENGHKLTLDGSISKNNDDNNGIVSGSPQLDKTLNNQVQNQFQIQADYVLPFGKGNQFEAGYKGNFSDLNNEYYVNNDAQGSAIDGYLSNTLQYKEKINALYTQYGFKKGKFSYLFGLRWEDTTIEVNLLDTNNFNTKKYNNFFPSTFISYEISNQSNLTASYSKRISRPRGRFMNPATNYASNVNIFRGNPDLDPSMTDKYDFGFIKRWSKVTFNTSAYFENTTDVFTFVRLQTGEEVNGVPVILSTPINLGKEQKMGFEFTLNYTPFKWWKLNSNFNLFNVKTTGDYTYKDANNLAITQNFDNTTFSWFARINSKVTLPYKIDWQTTAMYNGPQTSAQGKDLGQFGANIAFSKDILKEKGTLALNVSDIFNSRIMKKYTYLENVNSYSEMQFRKRQINLSFTYRFNKKKAEREKQPKNENQEGGGEFPG